MECHDRSACTEADELLGPVRRERELRNNARIFINQRQYPYPSPILGSVADKVIAPYVVAPLRPQPYTGTVVQPQPSSRPLLLRHFQPLSPPDPLDPILTHLPACPSQRLAFLASQTGRSKSFYLREIIERSLEDMEDYYLAADVLERLRQGKEYPVADVKNALDLDD